MKIRKIIFVALILSLASLVSCDSRKDLLVPFAMNEIEIKKNLLQDADFEKGFRIISQKDHSNNDAYAEIGQFQYSTEEQPIWLLVQWDSGPCLWANRIESDIYTITDGASKWVTYNPTEKSLLVRLDTEGYYQGNPSKRGDYWPHLIFQQEIPYYGLSEMEQASNTGNARNLTFSCDIRLPYFEATPIEDDHSREANIQLFFGVIEKTENKYVWFGMNLFSSDDEYYELSYHIDGGKDDATGLPIYILGTKEVYGENGQPFWKDGHPVATDEWYHVEVDLTPHLETLIKKAVDKGYFKEGTELTDLYFSMMSLGWETVATYDCGFEIKNVTLNSEVTYWE